MNNEEIKLDVNEVIGELRQRVSDLEYELMLKELLIKKMNAHNTVDNDHNTIDAESKTATV